MNAVAAPAVDAGTELAARLAFVVAGLNRRLRPPADGLTHVGLSALASVQREGAVRPGDLARLEGIGAPGMTRLVAELERRGLVDRTADPADGRSFLIRLSAEGEAEVARARAARAAGVARILETLDAADLPAVERAVVALEAALLAVAPAR